MIVVNQNEPPGALPERKYALRARVMVSGTLRSAPETESRYVYLQEDDFSNGIYVRSTPALIALAGRHLKLSGRTAEENVALKDGDKKLIVLQDPKEEK